MFEAENAPARRYRPYKLDLLANDTTSREAAAATAAHWLHPVRTRATAAPAPEGPGADPFDVASALHRLQHAHAGIAIPPPSTMSQRLRLAFPSTRTGRRAKTSWLRAPLQLQ